MKCSRFPLTQQFKQDIFYNYIINNWKLLNETPFIIFQICWLYSNDKSWEYLLVFFFACLLFFLFCLFFYMNPQGEVFSHHFISRNSLVSSSGSFCYIPGQAMWVSLGELQLSQHCAFSTVRENFGHFGTEMFKRNSLMEQTVA